MRKLYLIALVPMVFVAVTMFPPSWSIAIDQHINEKECFETKSFLDRQEAEQEIDRWESVLGDKMAGVHYNGLSEKSLTPTPLTVCVFTNK